MLSISELITLLDKTNETYKIYLLDNALTRGIPSKIFESWRGNYADLENGIGNVNDEGYFDEEYPMNNLCESNEYDNKDYYLCGVENHLKSEPTVSDFLNVLDNVFSHISTQISRDYFKKMYRVSWI